jgi:hypothetical protein
MPQSNTPPGNATATLVAAWVLVGAPLAWGVFKTAVNATALFK